MDGAILSIFLAHFCSQLVVFPLYDLAQMSRSFSLSLSLFHSQFVGDNTTTTAAAVVASGVTTTTTAEKKRWKTKRGGKELNVREQNKKPLEDITLCRKQSAEYSLIFPHVSRRRLGNFKCENER